MKNRTIGINIFFLAVILIFIAITSHNLSGNFYWDEAIYVDIQSHLFHTEFYPELKDEISKVLGKYSNWLFSENDMRGKIVFSRHPPLYMVLLRTVSFIPVQIEYLFRFLSILLSALGLFILFRLSLKLFDLKIIITSFLIIIFNTLFQQYSQSATMYALLFFFHSIIVYGYVKNRSVITTIGIIGGLYTHYFTFITLAIIFFLDFQEKRSIKKLDWKNYFAIFIIYLPWIYFAIPGLVYHQGKFASFFPSVNAIHFIQTFGVSGIIIFISWWILFFKNRNTIKNFFGDPQKRFTLLSMTTMLIFLFLFLISKPFLRYLYFLLPIWIISLVYISSQVSNFFQKRIGLLKSNLLFIIIILMLFIPNYKTFGVFPYSFSYHDAHDSIYHQEWEAMSKYIKGKPVTIENIYSYYLYFRKNHPEIPAQHYPWHNLGIFKLTYHENRLKSNIDKINHIKTPFVALSIIGNGKKEMITELKKREYVIHKKFRTSLLLYNKNFDTKITK